MRPIYIKFFGYTRSICWQVFLICYATPLPAFNHPVKISINICLNIEIDLPLTTNLKCSYFDGMHWECQLLIFLIVFWALSIRYHLPTSLLAFFWVNDPVTQLLIFFGAPLASLGQTIVNMIWRVYKFPYISWLNWNSLTHSYVVYTQENPDTLRT